MAEYFLGTGRRKTSIARVKMIPGTGKITINDKEMAEYFNKQLVLSTAARMPLVLVSASDKYDIAIDVKGGGSHSQADAIKLGIARALTLADPTTIAPLKKASLLTRDSREKERQKYGQKGARAKYQWSKR